MYRCTECNTEYEIKPEFCECGNDVFVEVGGGVVEEEEAYTPAAPSSIFERNSMEPQEEYREEIEEEKFSFDSSIVKKRKITITLMAVSIIAAILLFSFVGNEPPKIKADPEKIAAEQARLAKLAESIPDDVNAFWDSTPAYGKASEKNSVPLLNNNLSTIEQPLKVYLVSVGREFFNNWPKTLIAGNGICKIEFIINRDGTIKSSKIVEKSENESLNDSVLMALSKVSTVDAPPEQYRGERIHLVFQVKENGDFKVLYPH